MLTIGVEEEFFVVDPVGRDLAPDGLPDFSPQQDRSREDGGIQGFDHEFQSAVVESRTGVCESLGKLRTELIELRGTLTRAASHHGLAVLSSGTMPLADWRTARIVAKPRYKEIAEHYREVVQRRITCGCHVHIGIEDRDLAVHVLNRVRPWLSVLLALSASSPFYERADTGYHSSRSLLWGGFPVAGSPAVHESYGEYTATIQRLIETGAILDEGHVYWDARLGVRYKTLEFRIADACTTVDETVLQAGLCRALVLTCMEETTRGEPLPSLHPELLRAAAWRAARSGLEGKLVDVTRGESVPSAVLLARLLDYLRDALEESGDWDEVVALLEQAQHGGTSARRQCEVLNRTRQLEGVVDALLSETKP